MFSVEKTGEFQAWLDGFRDERAQFKINQRLLRLEGGNPGDWKTVGDGVSEMRIDYGPGYRVYYTIRGRVVYLTVRQHKARSGSRDQAGKGFGSSKMILPGTWPIPEL